MGREISTKKVLYLFAAIFPIIPSYFSVLGIGGTNFVAMLFALSILLIRRGNVKAFTIRVDYLGISLCLWVVCHFLSLVMTDSILQAIYFLLPSVIVCYFFVSIIRDEFDFLRLIGVIVRVSGVLAVFGIIEEVTGYNVFGILNTAGATLNYNPARFGMTRIISFSSHAIVYGAYLMFCLSLTIYLLQNTDSSHLRDRCLYRVIYFLLWVNVILTFSRSSILIIVFCQSLLLFFSGYKKFLFTMLKIAACACVLCFLATLLFPTVAKLLSGFYYMVLAVFIDKYTVLAQGFFSTGNEANAIGHRLDLYQWVFETMNSDHSWLFGHSLLDTFSYTREVTDGIYTWLNTKQSLEVQYLSLLYYYGLVGMVPEIFVYIAIVIKAFRNRKKVEWERNLSFNTVTFITLGSYYLLFFAVNQSSDRNIFYIFVMLFIAYNSLKRRQYR